MKHKIAVRSLIEFILKEGDLDFSYVGKNRGADGTKAHQVIQRSYEEKTQKEVFLSKTFEIEDRLIEVSGRMDGLIINEKEVIIDEIKSTTRDLLDIEIKDYPLHWAQGYFYAYIYMLENDLKQIKIQLTYVSLEDYSSRKFIEEKSIEALEDFVMNILKQYVQWLILEESHQFKRNLSIKSLKFPFEDYRKYQREIAVVTYQSIREKRNAFIQASTGIGKTMGTLFPSIKALENLAIDKIFYLTAKTITRTVAEESLRILINRGLKIKAITFTAKDKICFYEKSDCKIEKCRYMRGYYNHVKEAMMEALATDDLFNRENISFIAKKYQICPFEFSLDLSMFCDIIIGDYNYVFDPRVKLKRYFDETNYRISLLVDESHNLVNRGREMYSAELTKQDFLDLRREIKGKHRLLGKKLYKVNAAFLELKKNLEADQRFYQRDTPPEMLYDKLAELNSYIEGWLTDHKKDIFYEKVLEFYFETLAYTKINDLTFQGSIFYFERLEKNNYKAKLMNIDPSFHLKTINRVSATFFSATLSPIQYYKEILGGNETDEVFIFPTPFDHKNRKILFSNEISTRYNDRESTVALVSEYINIYINNNKGNSIVFFPSYAYMAMVLEDYQLKYDEKIHVQSQQMSEAAREDFIELFNQEENITAFVVLGGIFSEGIDLKGDKLQGVILVGIGLPGFGLENNIIRDYYDLEKSKGFEYAYAYPAIIKIMQAAGRVIRSKKDQGTILLLGDRFSRRYYRRMLPKDWGLDFVTIKSLEQELKRFWQENLE